MRISRLLACLTFCSTLGAGAANASLINFSFRDNLSDNQHSVTYTRSPVQLDVSAFKDAANANVNRALAGLGVTGNPNTGNMAYGARGADSTGPIVAESLLMQFTMLSGLTNLTLVSVLIDNMAPADTFNIGADGSFFASIARSDTTGSGQDDRLWTAPDSGAATAIGSFAFVATNGGVRIAEATFSVPEPATLGVVALGLAGMSYRGRRRARI